MTSQLATLTVPGCPFLPGRIQPASQFVERPLFIRHRGPVCLAITLRRFLFAPAPFGLGPFGGLGFPFLPECGSALHDLVPPLPLTGLGMKRVEHLGDAGRQRGFTIAFGHLDQHPAERQQTG